MRILPRIHLPRIKRLGRSLRRWRSHVTVARVVQLVELLIYLGTLVLVLTGSRAVWIDQLGQRADLAVLAAALALFVLLHFTVARRIVAALKRRFSPAAYDERRILFDLGQEARAATDSDQLYQSIINRIGEALQAENVSLFVRDDAAGDYLCRVLAPQMAPQEAEPNGSSERAIALRPVLACDAFVVKRLRHLAIPMSLGPEDFEVWRRALDSAPRQVRASREQECETLKQIQSQLLLQIMIKEQLVGILSLGPRRNGHPYSVADKEMLMSVAGQLAFVIENAKLAERMVAEERLRRELELAAKVQQRLLPAQPPASSVLELSGFCQPARGVGGDYYDFLAFDNQQIGIAIADVAGKGISAALLMSTVQASLRSQTMVHNAAAQPAGSLAELVVSMNRLLCRATGEANYVTFFYAQFDERTQELTYVNAGHNPPFLLRPSNGEAAPAAGESGSDAANGCLKLTTGGPFIGMFDQCCYEQETIQLHKGDLLVAYTDGVTEALNTAGEEFGEDRLEEAMMAVAHLPASEVRDRVVKRVLAWCVGAPQYDDLTFIVVKVKRRSADEMGS